MTKATCPFRSWLSATWRVIVLTAWLAGAVLLDAVHSAEKKYWDLSPYRIQLHIAVDCSAKPRATLGEELLEAIQQRVQATIFPLWSTDFSLAEGPYRNQLLSGLQHLDNRFIDEQASRFDKQLYLCVRASATGYALQSREYDCYLHRWGPMLSQNIRQEIALPERCYDLLRATFSPLATVRALPDDKLAVVLHFKGSDLPRRTKENLFVHPGDVYQPLLVRTSSTGETGPQDVREVPWTYLTLTESQQADWLSQVHSGIRTPFGLRRRGRVEHMAIAICGKP